MISSKTGLVRRRKTSEQRQRLLARFHQSQLTQREFAARHDIGLCTLGKKLRVESTAPLPPVNFKEVVLPHTPLRYAVEVVSPQGWIVRLQNSSEVQTLPQLLPALPTARAPPNTPAAPFGAKTEHSTLKTLRLASLNCGPFAKPSSQSVLESSLIFCLWR